MRILLFKTIKQSANFPQILSFIQVAGVPATRQKTPCTVSLIGLYCICQRNQAASNVDHSQNRSRLQTDLHTQNLHSLFVVRQAFFYSSFLTKKYKS
jgi:hypothetical protein